MLKNVWCICLDFFDSVFVKVWYVYINILSVCFIIFEVIDVSEIGLCFEKNWNDVMIVKVIIIMWKLNKYCLGFV